MEVHTMSEYIEQTGTEIWLPEIGQEIEGKVVDKSEGDYGTQWTIQKADGSLIKTPSHKVLQNRLVACKIGDEVKMVYDKDDAPSVKGFSPTKIYKVFIKKA